MKRKIASLFTGALFTLIVARPTYGEDASRTYHSETDDLLTIEKVTVLPFTDNLQGIYSRPLEADLISKVEKMHRWDYISATTSGPILAPEELESSPEKAKQVSAGMGVDAFFAGRVLKGPNGITVHLDLFLAKDGKLLSQAILKDYKNFDLASLKDQTARLLSEITTRLPYAGRVLSRDANRVTVNLGSGDGLAVNQMLTVIQILKAERHPKFNFLIRTEKEIIGRIKILKVDETLSFGTVVTEKERGAIQKNAKIGPLDFVTYSGSDLSLSGKPEDELGAQDKIAFGKDAHAWKPQTPPSFGQVGAKIGLSRVEEHTDLTSTGGVSAEDDIAPSVSLDGEIWITPEWTFHADLKQGLMSFGNPRDGSAPSKISQQLGAFAADLGYTVRFGPNVWSAKVEPFIGYFSTHIFSDTTNPKVFNSMTYSGARIGIRGETPVGVESAYGVGGQVSFGIAPSLSENPGTSGDSNSNGYNQIAVYGYKKLGERLKAQVGLEFEMFSTTFSGPGSQAPDGTATSTSLRFITLNGGIEFLF